LISELEWKGGFEAERVFATNEDTKNSLLFDLEVPGEKVVVADPYAPEWQQTILKQYDEIKHKKARSEIT